MNLADKIRILRKARGLSQEVLGESLSRVSKNGISRQSVSDWENGRNEPVLENIRDLASVLNVSFDALLDDNLDLNDKGTLNSVLNNAARQQAQQEKEESTSSPAYQIFEWDKSRTRALKIMIAFLVLVLITSYVDYMVFKVSNFQVFTVLTPTPKNIIEFIIYGMIIACAWIFFVMSNVLTVILFLLEVVILAHITKKDNTPVLVGELSNGYFTLYGNKGEGVALYLSIAEIEKIELHGKQKKYYGNIAITVVGDTKPIIVRNVTYPKKFIEFLEKSVNT